MHILVIGAAGMIGRKLVAAIVAQGLVQRRAVERLTLADIVAPQQAGFQAEQSFDEIIRVHIEDELGSALTA